MLRESKKTWFATVAVAFCAGCVALHAQGHAPYSTLYYKSDVQQGDILVNELRPTISSPATYFNALSWKGGYTGIQMFEDGGTGFIFSLWDPPGTESKPSVGFIYSAAGAVVDRFGGEGTGLHYLNRQSHWQLGHWYRFVVRCWDRGVTTRYGMWSEDENTGVWIHHATLETPEPHFRFNPFVAAFLEDWRGTPDRKRRVEYRGATVRSMTGQWSAALQANFKVDHNYTKPGPFANAFDAGVHDDILFIQTGGDTKPTVPDQAVFVPRLATAASALPNAPPAKILNFTAKVRKGFLLASWSVDDHSTPQFAYKLQAFTDEQAPGQPVVQLQGTIGPDDREAALKLDAIPTAPLYLKLTVIDIFDRQTSSMVQFAPK